MSVHVALLFIDDCPNREAVLPLLRRLIDEAGLQVPVTQQRVTSREEADRTKFLGSPTIRVDGVDIEPSAHERHDYGLQCRLYPTPHGLRGVPAEALIRTALRVDCATASRSRNPP
jgi:hypothetical protein